MPRKPMEFLTDILEKTYKRRQAAGAGAKRNDFIDAIIDEMNKSSIMDEFG